MFQPETLKKWGWKNCHWINLESAEFFFQEISYDQNQVVEWKKKRYSNNKVQWTTWKIRYLGNFFTLHKNLPAFVKNCKTEKKKEMLGFSPAGKKPSSLGIYPAQPTIWIKN